MVNDMAACACGGIKAASDMIFIMILLCCKHYLPEVPLPDQGKLAQTRILTEA
jgi:hypothetical protein